MEEDEQLQNESEKETPEKEETPPPSPDPELDLESIDISSITEYIQGQWQGLPPIPNNEYLGRLIEDIIEIAYPPDPRPQFPPGPFYFPIKIILLGAPFTGKKTMAKKLTEKYGVKFFDIDKILEDRARVLERKAEIEEGKKPKPLPPGQEETEVFMEACSNYTENTPQDYAELIRAKLLGLFGTEPKLEEEVKKGKKEEVKCQGYGLIGYPRNLEEAKALELTFSSYIHPADLPEPIASIKKRNAAFIAHSGERTPKPQVKEKSAWDRVFLLRVQQETLIRRCIDRKIDPQGNVWNTTFYPPPDNIVNKCHVPEHPNEQELIEMLESYYQYEGELINWFDWFGNGYQSSLIPIEEALIDGTLEQIDQNIEELLNYQVEEEQVQEGNQNVRIARNIVKQWEYCRIGYLKNLDYVLKFVNQIGKTTDLFKQKILDNYKDFLIRPDHKLEIVRQYASRLDSFLKSRGLLSTAARQQLEEEIDEISDQIWDIMNQRKEENLDRREAIIQETSNNKLYVNIVNQALLLIKAEVERFYQTNKIIENVEKLDEEPSFEIKIPDLRLNKQLPIIKDDQYPRLQDITTKVRNLASDPDQNFQLTSELHLRIDTIEQWALKSLQGIQTSLNRIYDTLDQWITDTIAAENDMLNLVLNNWKNSIANKQDISAFEIQDNSAILDRLTIKT